MSPADFQLWLEPHVTLTFDLPSPEVDHYCSSPWDHLCQSALKSAHSLSKYSVHKLVTDERTDGQTDEHVENIKRILHQTSSESGLLHTFYLFTSMWSANVIAVTTLLLTSGLHRCRQGVFEKNASCFRAVRIRMLLAIILRFSFKLVTFSKSYARKQKWLFFLNTAYNCNLTTGYLVTNQFRTWNNSWGHIQYHSSGN